MVTELKLSEALSIRTASPFAALCKHLPLRRIYSLIGRRALEGPAVGNCGWFGMFLKRPLTLWTFAEAIVMAGLSWGLFQLSARDGK